MATNKSPFLYNMISGSKEPLIVPGLFQAGATQAIKRGEILEFTGDTNSKWVPLDSDADITVGVAVAAEEIKSGDRAGYYPIIVPRPGDVFEFALSASGDPVMGASLYYSDSQTFAETGSNVMAFVAGWSHYPQYQGHLADDASGDRGTTLRYVTYVHATFKLGRSWWTVMNWDGA
jgi:hypothetical protein